MEVLQTTTEGSSSRTSLLDSSPQQPRHDEGDGDGDGDRTIDEALRQLETFLRVFGFCQYSLLSFALSSLSFLVFGVVTPLLCIELSNCSNCEKYQIKSTVCGDFSSWIATMASDPVPRGVRAESPWVFPVAGDLDTTLPPCEDYPLCFVQLVCNLQVIHYENYGKLLERDLDILVYIEEHIVLTHHLSKISHRFRIFLLLEFLVVTASQFVALFQTTGNRGIINFVNGSDFVVSSIVQVVGIILCLHGATKISHRARGISSVGSRWHALVTCNSNEASQSGTLNSRGNMEASQALGSLPINYSESDLESIDVPLPVNTQLVSYMARTKRDKPSYDLQLPISHMATSFSFANSLDKDFGVMWNNSIVCFLSASNPGGFTVFGWIVDRGLIITILFVELSLVLFVLGKTITYTTT
ncbi:hypothetical protein CK203_068906 [Vitis vinifera]|uniref:Uncharacterized protein n=1 Tax=Vitis vinifera TaxID=29760 RepID=A0A438EY38_VITVI|nr:hypothetical protein CK203_068906 [Vitis vinifera]